MLYNIKPQDCSGCTACKSICPRQCISMKPDGLGFLYPIIDTNICIDCGLCEKVCPFNTEYKTPENLAQSVPFASRQQDIKEVEKSRSGGIFAALSDEILTDGGVIYGAGYDNAFRVLHKRAVTKEQRDEFRGSKYVQSDLTDIFKQVEADLKNNLKVMFTGTPCQTAGLQSFLRLKRINRKNLIVCDIVCHGVPAPFIWHDYLKYIEKKEGKKIIGVNFRDKSKFGWTAHKESFKLSDTYTYTYNYTIYKHIMFRHSCGCCPFTNLRRTGDITLADYWGWEKTDRNINADDKGVSLLLINTEQGKLLYSRIADRVISIQTTLDKCMQPNLSHPSVIHPKRQQFEEYYIKYGFYPAMRKFALMGYKLKIRQIYGKSFHIIQAIYRKIFN